MLKTPPNRWIFFLLLNCAWFGIEYGVFQLNSERGVRDSAVGSVGMPEMISVAVALIVLWPVVNVVALILLKGARFPAPLNAFNERHPKLNVFFILCAIAYSSLVATVLIGAYAYVPQFTYCELPGALLGLYLIFSMRAAQMNRDPLEEDEIVRSRPKPSQ